MNKLTAVVRYFWVPEYKEGRSDFRLPLPASPLRVQTVLSHRRYDTQTGELISSVDANDPGLKPSLPADQGGMEVSHNFDVFLEDRVHDWQYRNGHLRYYSRINKGGCWIRCEFGP